MNKPCRESSIPHFFIMLVLRMVASLCLLLQFATRGNLVQAMVETHWNESKISCTFITHDNGMALTWDMSESEMEECILEIEQANWKEIHTVPDDTNSGMRQLLYVFDEPFIVPAKPVRAAVKHRYPRVSDFPPLSHFLSLLLLPNYSTTLKAVSAVFNDTTEYDEDVTQQSSRRHSTAAHYQQKISASRLARHRETKDASAYLKGNVR
ncbi:unnamed protein product [Litomosoides sigmodontis]|uniref:Uncharacterized protein n=1 Tax=Litomosoides sigmodontis TaxID=42156 RepID=A0A3P6TE65_LITSI|nr:unnamed protein product [Litomosoides sigmodontis]